ncbi:hypothetical protein K469DRAFT_126595 [Zopfia rhizophila CBS 207.26]|uniref:Uncharacterized protein n=1 Tax=Zopfia rhizophila CBS 207.26 TaxID=1314779 RepID=A0A6A6EUI4_9PEZI|nr:hypothetical protein K469DRAFT_126595 [Zopfia rhizophila CBS 207.26]
MPLSLTASLLSLRDSRHPSILCESFKAAATNYTIKRASRSTDTGSSGIEICQSSFLPRATFSNHWIRNIIDELRARYFQNRLILNGLLLRSPKSKL